MRATSYGVFADVSPRSSAVFIVVHCCPCASREVFRHDAPRACQRVSPLTSEELFPLLSLDKFFALNQRILIVSKEWIAEMRSWTLRRQKDENEELQDGWYPGTFSEVPAVVA